MPFRPLTVDALLLAEGTVHVWCINPRGVDNLRGADGILSAAERQRLSALADLERRAQREFAWAARRIILSRYTRTETAELEFFADNFGRPGLSHPRIENFFFNLSHTSGFSVLAIASTRVGVDVENIIAVDFGGVETNQFTSDERSCLAKLKGASRLRAFYRLWTQKEAYVKAVGLGFTLPLQLINFGKAGGFCDSDVDAGKIFRERSRLMGFSPSARHIAAVAVESLCKVTVSKFDFPRSLDGM